MLEQLSKENSYLFGISPSILDQWSKLLPKLIENPKIQNYFSNLVDDFTKKAST